MKLVQTVFLIVTHFIITYYISLENVQINYCNNKILNFDVKQLNKIMKLYYFYTLKALQDGQGKIKMYYGMSRVKMLLSGKRSISNSRERSRLKYIIVVLDHFSSNVRILKSILHIYFCFYSNFTKGCVPKPEGIILMVLKYSNQTRVLFESLYNC